MSADRNALCLQWAFGFNKDLRGGVHSLCDESRTALFYAAAHSGVIYDCATRTQRLLQGHCNPIACAVVSADKRWLVTADAGADSLIVVWDSYSGAPIKTLFNPHAGGVAAIDISPDAMFLVTLSNVDEAAAAATAAVGGVTSALVGDDDAPDTAAPSQQLALWEWTADRDTPLHAETVPPSGVQTAVRFNPSDVREIITNGARQVFFWTWETEFACYSPHLSRHDFRQAIGDFTVSAFLPSTTQAITATCEGDLVLWDMPVGAADGLGAGGAAGGAPGIGADGAPLEKVAIKVIRLCGGALNHVSTIGRYLCLAGNDGAVRFYDFMFRLEAWFEDLEAGAVTSVSFSATAADGSDGMGGELEPAGKAAGGAAGGAQTSLDFAVPDFVVGTRSATIIGLEAALFGEIDAAARRGTVLVQGMSDEVHGVACHPHQSQLLIACFSGGLYLWDYYEKLLLMVRMFNADRLKPLSLAFDPTGEYAAVGFASGVVKIVAPDGLGDLFSFKNGKDAIVETTFSPDGRWLATADADHKVALWTLVLPEPLDELEGDDGRPADGAGGGLTEEEEARKRQPMWTYVGRYRAHTRAITGLQFGARETGELALVSVAEDRTLVEYDLARSSVESGVRLVDAPRRIEQSAVPTACAWHPLLGGDFEDRVITASSEYKLKEWNADNKHCRRTSVGPTFGGPLNRLLNLHARDPATGEVVPSEYLAYGTHEKVVGLVKMPLDGNPNKAMGLIAHPGAVTAIAATHDARFLVTAGGADLTVNLWAIDADAIDAAEAAGGGGVEPYTALLEGGAGGELHEELIDYFYYAQLRTQGEDTTAPRDAKGAVPLAEIPNLMRALGFYPAEQEVANMVSEVKYSQFTRTGEVLDTIDLPSFIRLYVNHRPVFGVGKEQIAAAFETLATSAAGGGGVAAAIGAGDDAAPEAISWPRLAALLQEKGEKLSADELQACVRALTGENEPPLEELTAPEFVDQVLGFEDFDNDKGEQQ